MQIPVPVAPTPDSQCDLRPLRQGSLTLLPGFWKRWQQRNREVSLPHGIAKLRETECLANFERAALPGGKFSPPHFKDHDVYAVLEAVAWERQHGLAPELEMFRAEVTELLGRAQRPDGYLNTYVQLCEPEGALQDPENNELFCAGHLLQAAVADARTSHDDRLLGVAQRYASFIEDELLSRGRVLVEDHPEMEMALFELYREDGQDRHARLAALMLEQRGYKSVRGRRTGFGPAYYLDDLPFLEARTMRGHAVRAVYLAAGGVDAYLENGDKSYLQAAVAQWEDMVATKTYLTGGIGSRFEGEAFGSAYELPDDVSYCETCAAIGSVMLSWRLLLATGEARYADLMERTLFNAVLVGVGIDGKTFYYSNALRSDGWVDVDRPQHSRRSAERQEWFDVACCPPNIMRLLSTIEHYAVTKSASGLQFHQYMPMRLEVSDGSLPPIELEIASGYPWDGAVAVTVLQADEKTTIFSFRVPGWASEARLSVNGKQVAAEPDNRGYVSLERPWKRGDEVLLEFPITPRWTRPDSRIRAVRGCVALERGPLVYCFEEIDQHRAVSSSLLDLGASVHAQVDVSEMRIADEAFPIVKVKGAARTGAGNDWPYRPADEVVEGPSVATELTAIPYYARANRGPSPMTVWLPGVDDGSR